MRCAILDSNHSMSVLSFMSCSVPSFLVVFLAQLAQDRADFGIVESDEDSDTEDAQRRAEIEKMKVCVGISYSRVTCTLWASHKKFLGF
jgi:hypothetical protein